MGLLSSDSASRRAARRAPGQLRAAESEARDRLEPFADISQAQLPLLRESATQQGTIADLLSARGAIPEAFSGVIDARGDAARAAAESAGLSIPEQTFSDISSLDPILSEGLTFDLADEFGRRRQELFQPGSTAGNALGNISRFAQSGIQDALNRSKDINQAGRNERISDIAGLLGLGAGLINRGGGESDQLTPDLGSFNQVQSPFEQQTQGGMSLIPVQG